MTTAPTLPTDPTEATKPVLRVTDAGVQVPTVTLTLDGKRTVEVVGVMHIADKEFWNGIRSMVTRRLARGVEVQSELIRNGPRKPLLMYAVLIPVEVALIAGTYTQGLRLQTLMLPYDKDDTKIHVHDVTGYTAREHLGEKMYDYALPAMGIFAYTLMLALGRRGRVWVFRQKNAAVPVTERTDRVGGLFAPLHRLRESIAVRAVNNSPNTHVVTLWGAGHVSGIVDKLLATGWTITDVSWRTALAAPVEGEES